MSIRLLLLLFLSLNALAQIHPSVQTQPSQFTGVVLDMKSKRIPNVKVLVEGANQKWNLKSDHMGEFRLDLPVGKYQFTLTKPHYKRHIWTEFCISSGSKISYEFKMESGECNDCGGPSSTGAAKQTLGADSP